MHSALIEEVIEDMRILTGLEILNVDEIPDGEPYIKFSDGIWNVGTASAGDYDWAYDASGNPEGWFGASIRIDVEDYPVVYKETIMHEVLHVFGLGHTGQFDGSDFFADKIKFDFDNHYISMQNYGAEDYGLRNENPGPADLEVLWSKFGSSPVEINSGNDIYDFSDLSNTMNIVDTGGVDTILFGEQTWVGSDGLTGVYADLRPGSVNALNYSNFIPNPTKGLWIDYTSNFTLMGEVSDVAGNIIFEGSLIENIVSSGGNDILIGNEANNTIEAGEGDDTVFGLDQNDILFGQGGDDVLFGGSGIDAIWGGDDDDTLEGGEGNDYLWGESGNDELFGGLGDDEMHGGLDQDTLHGESGNDHLRGGAGNDVLNGEFGSVYRHVY
jgi:hypothetical protein